MEINFRFENPQNFLDSQDHTNKNIHSVRYKYI